MTNIKKFLGMAGAVALFALPVAASASTNNVLYDNGNGGTQVNSGESVTMHAFVNTNANQALESVFVSYPGSTGIAQHGKCYTLTPPQEGASPVNGWDVAVQIDNTPTSSGSWGPNVTFYGINGDPIDTQCAGTPVFATQFFPNRLVTVNTNTQGTVTGNSSGIGSGTTGGTGTGTTTATDQKLDKLIELMGAVLGKLSGPTTGSGSQSCQALSAVMDSLAVGSMGQGVSNLQVFLMTQGEHVTNSGTPTMYFGPLTAAAVASFKLHHGCN